MTNINRMIYDEMILSNAVHYAANQARNTVGYNTIYHFLSGIDVVFDLLDRGPDRIYDDQYRKQAEAEYGVLIDPTKDTSLSKHEQFLALEQAYKRISVYEDGVLVRRVEGKDGCHCSYHRDGKRWREELIHLYKKGDAYHLINPTGREPSFEEDVATSV